VRYPERGSEEANTRVTKGSRSQHFLLRKSRSVAREILDRCLWVVLAVLVIVLLEILMPAWPCFFPHSAGGLALTERRIRELESLAYGYRQARSHYPRTSLQFKESIADFRPMMFQDGWGRPFIYRCPGRANTHAFDLYSAGMNGIDDKGRGDDVTNWYAPHPLYYQPEHHRGLLVSTLFDGFAALVVGWLLWTLIRWRRVYYLTQRGRRLEFRWLNVPAWLGLALATILAAAVFLHFPTLKAEYYYWRWTNMIPRPPGAPHTNVDDAAEVLIYMGTEAGPVVTAKLTSPALAGPPKAMIREQTVRLLGLMGDPTAIPTLRELLLSKPGDSYYVRHIVSAHALRRLGDRSVLWVLFGDILRRKDVRGFWSSRALELLTWHSFGDITPQLAPEEADRRVSLWHVWWQQNQQRDESQWLREGVEQALAQLTSDDLYLRNSAIRRLRRITGMRFFIEPYMVLSDRQGAAEVWRRWWEEHRERYAHATFDSVDRRLRTVQSLYLMEW